MNTPSELRLFEAFGVELEYMIVDSESLAVRPIADRLLRTGSGEYSSEEEHGDISWSNELALHVIELKTNGPASNLAPLAELFQHQVRDINGRLAPEGARLMPSAMHPWMDPDAELRLWPHDYNAVYEAYHRIFDCRGHGWANLQSVHLNLPFADADEFGRLHTAIRLLLPILPAMAASSPIAEGKPTGSQDTRMKYYRTNSARIPLVTGHVVPEPVSTPDEYQRDILEPLYEAIAPHDPDGILREEWLNARGAIARFDRNAIEIRVLDVQECPLADVALCGLIVAVLRRLVEQSWTPTDDQRSLDTVALSDILEETTRDAERAVLEDRLYLAQFGYPGERASAQELWQHLLGYCTFLSPAWIRPLEIVTQKGPLARRITESASRPDGIRATYQRLCECLANGEMFVPGES